MTSGKEFRTELSYEERGHGPRDTESDNMFSLTCIPHDEVWVTQDILPLYACSIGEDAATAW